MPWRINFVAPRRAHAEVIFLEFLHGVRNGYFIHHEISLVWRVHLAFVKITFERHFFELHAVSVDDVIVVGILILLAKAIGAPPNHSGRALATERRLGHFS